MNIKFEYLYRDGANYKQFGEAIFSNSALIEIATIDEQIRKCLIDNEWFYPAEWGLKDLHYFDWEDEIDHSLHEYHEVSQTDEVATKGDISDFLKSIGC